VPDELPFIDEFDAVAMAPAPAVFLALSRRFARSLEGRVARIGARVLGCAHQGTSLAVPLAEGQEGMAFRVAEVCEPKRLVLEGRHRFASYRLTFLVETLEENRTQLRARTEAAFPGMAGAAYRALVIGSGGHEIVVKRMLAMIAAGAERSLKDR
jgi:hypothetical protein